MNGRLKKLALQQIHQEHGARFVPFAGYQMPLHYREGVKHEHLHCREKASLFDISHMGRIVITGKDRLATLEYLTPAYLAKLGRNRQTYALLTNELGGIMDDVIVSNLGDSLLLVVNASNVDKVLTHIERYRVGDTQAQRWQNSVMVALQGPKAIEVLQNMGCDEVEALTFMQIMPAQCLGFPCWISRSGYTGEDGFELIVDAENSVALVEELLSNMEVKLAGLGARDTLRLEAGLCLYGNELTEKISPLEANLRWTMKKVVSTKKIKAPFLGYEALLAQMNLKCSEFRLIGLKGLTAAPVRSKACLFDENNREIGWVSSGSYSPTLGQPIAMGYVSTSLKEQRVFAQVRTKMIPMQIVQMPFISPKYVR